MTCPASVTIDGVEYRCTTTEPGHFCHVHHGLQVLAKAWWRQDVPAPEREWQPGDIVVDALDRLAVRRDPSSVPCNGYPWSYDGTWVTDKYLERPLTRLVPEVTP